MSKVALLALIPPLAHLDFGDTGINLILAHLCNDTNYIQYFRQRSIKGDYIILDNSTYEWSKPVSMEMLLSLGYYIQISEIVAPDQIMNEQGTFAHTLQSVSFMSTPAGQFAWKRAGSPRIMVVPQVNPAIQDIDSYQRHAHLLMETWHTITPYLSGHITLGVSKNMDKLHGGWLGVFREVVQDLVKEYPIQVHTLGLPHHLTAVREIIRENPYIRSLDTAQPFVSALSNLSMQIPDDVYPPRPDNYMDLVMDEDQLALAKANIYWIGNILLSQPFRSNDMLEIPNLK